MSDDDMKISVLASGSTGNVTYIETPKHKMLVDAGLSGKKIEGLMNSIGRDLADVDSLFITHEHTDHIQGAGVLARRYNLDLYANQGTWRAIEPKIGPIPEEKKNIFEVGKTKSFGDIDVESFAVSHDAAEPQFYEFHHNGKTFVILTDTGYVSERVEGQIENADAYLFEVNHDVEMLRMGGYPWPLKQRILSDHGHLSNEAGANALMDVMGYNTKKIFLGHLSLHNNMKELAHLTVASMMKNKDLAVGHDFQLFDTDHTKATKLTAI
ncbi:MULTISPECIES: MBL fold metallo-hydrolase [Pediococcus]|jgi:phosphoribosyl 1,2-cyclic phosphodiesterase|uniref:Metallohydrolase n=1 Tax=Pediococcus parvulus TaxID=54062 RepID=A0ABX2UD34_9LACO|nr:MULTISPECIES: MBL fold metallo-hydrolase [Pediococcus]MCT3027841.1 MBL fold metallo-hydrolase [Pediococcus parvulus]MCT3029028.1 MBL fold metallo-hydrolase [Pediococcus parvulus]MCT3032063.1 MBL fold metallo-hydrolase [Pediococcus parvulus]MCT3035071.1 MBL fold metallo-hydrolase [Pediococcus parvulus]MDN5575852.1 MBL fold metallo-hydrolase [Pediococcus sp.]